MSPKNSENDYWNDYWRRVNKDNQKRRQWFRGINWKEEAKFVLFMGVLTVVLAVVWLSNGK